jgi:hypothetical protein
VPQQWLSVVYAVSRSGYSTSLGCSPARSSPISSIREGVELRGAELQRGWFCVHLLNQFDASRKSGSDLAILSAKGLSASAGDSAFRSVMPKTIVRGQKGLVSASHHP